MDTAYLQSDDVGRGWREPAYGEIIRSSWQVYRLRPRGGVGQGKPQGWVLGSCFTAEAFKHEPGITRYRAPASLRVWVTICLPLVSKLARGYWRKLRTGSFV